MAVIESCLVELNELGENPRASATRGSRPLVRLLLQNLLKRSIELKLTLSSDAAAPQQEPAAESTTLPDAVSFDDLVFVTFADNRTVVPDDDRVRTADVLDTIYGLASRNMHRRAMEHVARYVDELLNNGKFLECDAMLRAAAEEMAKLSEPVIVAFLGITLAARDKLAARAGFYDRAFNRIKNHSGEAEAEEVLLRYK